MSEENYTEQITCEIESIIKQDNTILDKCVLILEVIRSVVIDIRDYENIEDKKFEEMTRCLVFNIGVFIGNICLMTPNSVDDVIDTIREATKKFIEITRENFDISEV